MQTKYGGVSIICLLEFWSVICEQVYAAAKNVPEEEYLYLEAATIVCCGGSYKNEFSGTLCTTYEVDGKMLTRMCMFTSSTTRDCEVFSSTTFTVYMFTRQYTGYFSKESHTFAEWIALLVLHLKEVVDEQFPVHVITPLPKEADMVRTVWIPSDKCIPKLEQAMAPDFKFRNVSFSCDVLDYIDRVIQGSVIPNSMRDMCQSRIQVQNENRELSAKTTLVVEQMAQVWKRFCLIQQAMLQSEMISQDKFLQNLTQVCSTVEGEMRDISSKIVSYEIDEILQEDEVLRMYHFSFKRMPMDAPGSHISYNHLVSLVLRDSIENTKAHMMKYAEELEKHMFTLIGLVGRIDVRSQREMQKKLKQANETVRTILCIPGSMYEELKLTVPKCLLQTYDCTPTLL